jgi:hypothetical protein
MPLPDTWGLESKLDSIASAVKELTEIEPADVGGIIDTLESIDTHLVELVDGNLPALVTVLERIADALESNTR